MLDPEVAGAVWQKHFDTVTDEEFIRNVRRFNPDLAQEMWGDLSVPEIVRRRLDPQTARAALKEYYATATDQQIVDDLRHYSPELARRLGVDGAAEESRLAPGRRGIRGFFETFQRSVLRLFS
jgi:hypothetical protein